MKLQKEMPDLLLARMTTEKKTGTADFAPGPNDYEDSFVLDIEG
jgi:hypothetical protein